MGKTRASIYSVFFENRFRFFSIPILTNPIPNPIPKTLKKSLFSHKPKQHTCTLETCENLCWYDEILIKFTGKWYLIWRLIGALSVLVLFSPFLIKFTEKHAKLAHFSVKKSPLDSSNPSDGSQIRFRSRFRNRVPDSRKRFWTP